MFQPLWATLTTIGVGAASWIIVAMFGGRREAWDSELYFAVLPFTGLLAGVVSYFAPVRFWRWAFYPFLGQVLVMFAQGIYESGGAGAALLPLGLIVFAILGTFCMIPAAIGAVSGRKAAAAKVAATP
jgi:hypothetical protein